MSFVRPFAALISSSENSLDEFREAAQFLDFLAAWESLGRTLCLIVLKLDLDSMFILGLGRVTNSNFSSPLSLSPGVLRCICGLGALTRCPSGGLLDVQRCLLLGQVL